MSSTSIVVKCLADSKATASPHGQITIGTLILQARAAHCSILKSFFCTACLRHPSCTTAPLRLHVHAIFEA
jgi:predicted Kef-type K+ transport protein